MALELSESTVLSIEEWREPLVKQYPFLKWTRRNQFHVTLRFLGNRDPEQVISEIEALHLEGYLPAEYSLSRIGHFGKPPSVLWLSGKFSSKVYALNRCLDSIQDGSGLSGSSSHFTPHITLARVKRGKQCPIISFHRQIPGLAKAIHLMNSELTGSGPSYSTLFTAASPVL